MISKTEKCWYICTDADKVFHLVECVGEVSTAQPYVVKGLTEDEVVSKVFENPVRGENREYNLDLLTKKTKSLIISNSE